MKLKIRRTKSLLSATDSSFISCITGQFFKEKSDKILLKSQSSHVKEFINLNNSPYFYVIRIEYLDNNGLTLTENSDITCINDPSIQEKIVSVIKKCGNSILGNPGCATLLSKEITDQILGENNNSIYSIRYEVPFKKNDSIIFLYEFSNIDLTNSTFLPDELEFVSSVFYPFWMYRFGVIDREQSKLWVESLIDMTPARLWVLREMVSSVDFHSAEYAKKLGISASAINNHLEFAHRMAANTKGDAEVHALARRDSLRRRYEFLRWMGPRIPKC